MTSLSSNSPEVLLVAKTRSTLPACPALRWDRHFSFILRKFLTPIISRDTTMLAGRIQSSLAGELLLLAAPYRTLCSMSRFLRSQTTHATSQLPTMDRSKRTWSVQVQSPVTLHCSGRNQTFCFRFEFWRSRRLPGWQWRPPGEQRSWLGVFSDWCGQFRRGLCTCQQVWSLYGGLLLLELDSSGVPPLLSFMTCNGGRES